MPLESYLFKFKLLPFMKTEVGNILRVFHQATPDEMAYGLNWYHLANKECRSLASEFCRPVSAGAGVVAALSPNQSWGTTLMASRRVFEAVQKGLGPGEVVVPTYPLNKEKAFQIARGRRPLAVLGGPKVLAFYHTIMYPAKSDLVVVDGHAYSIWAGQRHILSGGDKGVPVPRLTARGRYETVTEDYRDAARTLSLRPWQVQAVTWVVWRRLIKVWTNSQDQERRVAA
jgi:hypothetical protein